LFQLNQAAIEQMVAQEQSRQQQMVFLSKLTEIAFEKCIVKPDAVLSSSETDCISSVMHKHVDAQKLVIGRYQRQSSKQALN
jgi:hypothetical protein